MKKLCHQQVGEENKSLSSFCHNRVLATNSVATELATNSVTTKPDFVATEPVKKLSCNKLFCDKPDFVTTELAVNFVVTKPYFVVAEPVTRLFFATKPRFCRNRVQHSFSNKLCRDKPDFVAKKFLQQTLSRQTKFCRDRVSNKLYHDKPDFVTIDFLQQTRKLLFWTVFKPTSP